MFALGLGLRLLLALVSGIAGVAKCRRSAFGEFVVSLDEMRVPAYLRSYVAGAVICAEISSAVLIVFTPTAFVGAFISLLLFASLTLGVLHVVRSGKQVRCACFGAATRRLGWRHFWRNALLLFVAVVVLGLSGVGSMVPAQLPIAFAVAVPGAVGIVFLDDIWAILMEE